MMQQQLSTFVNEKLTKDGNVLLAFLKRTDRLTDGMIKDLAITAGVDPEGKEYKSWLIDDSELMTYVIQHGLGSDSINRNDMNEVILKEFNKNKTTKLLKNIISNGGACSFDEFCANHNIFDFCKGWNDIAKTLANLNSAKSRIGGSTIGKYELLMRFIIKESVTPRKGDITVNLGGTFLSMEVKGDMGVLKSQKGGGSITDMTERIFSLMTGDIGSGSHIGFFNQAGGDIFAQVKGLKNTIKSRSGGFFRNEENVRVLQDMMNYLSLQSDGTYGDRFGVHENPDMEGSLFDILARAISVLYDAPQNIADNVCLALVKVNENPATNFIKFDKKNGYSIHVKKMFDAVGAAQMYEYRWQEGFDCLCIIDQASGRYAVVSPESLDSCDLIGILQYCTFKANKADDGRGGSCRIYYRK